MVHVKRTRSINFWRQIMRALRFVLSSKAGPLPRLLALLVVAYMIWPVDLIPGVFPISLVDDAVVLWLGTRLLNRLIDEVEPEEEQKIDPRSADVIDTTARTGDDFSSSAREPGEH